MNPSEAGKVRRGEVWLAALGPVQGAEMDKTRPVIIVSADAVGVFPVRIAAPCTSTALTPAPWTVPLAATAGNGLDGDTTVDLMMLQSISVTRLIRKLGEVDADTMEEVAAMIAALVEYE
jgi:mRNA interferase MazF